MKKIRIMILVIVFFSISSTAVAQWSDEAGPDLSYGVSIGYDIGMPVQGHFLVSNLAEGFPFAFRFTISYSFLWDAGIPDAGPGMFLSTKTIMVCLTKVHHSGRSD